MRREIILTFILIGIVTIRADFSFEEYTAIKDKNSAEVNEITHKDINDTNQTKK